MVHFRLAVVSAQNTEASPGPPRIPLGKGNFPTAIPPRNNGKVSILSMAQILLIGIHRKTDCRCGMKR